MQVLPVPLIATAITSMTVSFPFLWSSLTSLLRVQIWVMKSLYRHKVYTVVSIESRTDRESEASFAAVCFPLHVSRACGLSEARTDRCICVWGTTTMPTQIAELGAVAAEEPASARKSRLAQPGALLTVSSSLRVLQSHHQPQHTYLCLALTAILATNLQGHTCLPCKSLARPRCKQCHSIPKLQLIACRSAPRAGLQLEAMERQWSKEAELGAALRGALLCTPADQTCSNGLGDPQLQVVP